MNAVVAKIAQRLLGEYELYRIYELPLPSAQGAPGDAFDIRPLEGGAEASASPDPELRSLSGYAGADAVGYGAFVGNELGAGCWLWYGEWYRQRNFWPLKEQEAKLVQVTTGERYRGKGLGLRLLNHAAWDMSRRGFRILYARIWHSNVSSIKLFEKAGWREIAFVAVIFPLGIGRGISLRFNRRRIASP